MDNIDMEENGKYDYQELVAKFLSGNATAEEIEQLYQWIGESDENRNKYLSTRMSWLTAAQFNQAPVDTSKALKKVNQRMIHSSQNKYYFKRYLRIASVFATGLLIGIVCTFFWPGTKNEKTIKKDISFFAPMGAKAITVLPDGSKVWLNAGSSLTYDPVMYGQSDRFVTLVGEGYFKVASNKKKPFIVSAKNLKIKALGTEFNVKAYPEENKIETTLVNGVIKVEGSGADKKNINITLIPKQKMVVFSEKVKMNHVQPSGSLVKSPAVHVDSLPKVLSPVVEKEVKTDLYTSWKDGKWIIEGENIGDLAVQLERKFNVQITFNSDELKKYKFTGTFQNETLEQVMKVLKMTAPLTFKIEKGRVELNIDPELRSRYKKYMKYY